MLQEIEGQLVYVADLKTMPELPITWETSEEEPYARCLDNAIRTGVITEPGKYGIRFELDTQTYKMARIIEE